MKHSPDVIELGERCWKLVLTCCDRPRSMSMSVDKVHISYRKVPGTMSVYWFTPGELVGIGFYDGVPRFDRKAKPQPQAPDAVWEKIDKDLVHEAVMHLRQVMVLDDLASI